MAIRLKVSARLALGFGALMFLMISLTLLGLYSMSSINDNVEEIVNDNVHKTTLLEDMSESVHIVSRVTRTIMLLKDDAAIQTEMKKIDAAREVYDKSFEAFDKTRSTEKEKALRANVESAGNTARALNRKVGDLAVQHKTDEALTLLLSEAAPATQKWQDALHENSSLQRQANDADAAEAAASYSKARALMLMVFALSAVVGTIAAVLITRGLLRQLGGEPDEAMTVAARIASGDLTVPIMLRRGDDKSLMYAMQAMRDSLVNIVGQVRSGTDTITTASSEIASGNLDLSSRTEQQASSLEETASAMEQLTGTVKQNADNSRQANQLATTASEIAQKGGAVVSQVVDTMSSINESARKIVDIIGVIDSIAFQTNILALNAAVEAARAGEQGRGFAVVASEVRNLAQRSAGAAKEIKLLIGDSVEKVDAGSKLVGQAGSTMREIVDSVRQVTDIMGEITAASQEQTTGIEQINQAISQMDQVTQQNAALVEQAAAAAESLQEQAVGLAQVVSVFQIDSAHTASTQDARTKEVASHAGKTAKAHTGLAIRAGMAPARTVAPARRLALVKTGIEEWEEL
ncbi:MAG: MCP four helix bundle domain-containing protein [Herminiimonas sp.]|nr:MCP four helix bundle domain-containing protein [Herminiimonas sp.]